jgi:hypothetical protein
LPLCQPTAEQFALRGTDSEEHEIGGTGLHEFDDFLLRSGVRPDSHWRRVVAPCAAGKQSYQIGKDILTAAYDGD